MTHRGLHGFAVVRQAEHEAGAARHQPRKRVVVVGYDGTSGGRAALVHAAGRTTDGGHLIVLQALPRRGRRQAAGDGASASEIYADAVTSLLAAVRAELPTSATYEVRIVTGSVAVALAETAERNGASEVVIGTRHRGTPFTGSTGVGGAVRARTRIPVEVIAARPHMARLQRAREPGDSLDPVEQRGLESFPASDPPPWWCGS